MLESASFMKKISILLLLAAVLAFSGFLFFSQKPAPRQDPPVSASDCQNAVFVIGGIPVTLAHGHSETPLAGSSEKIMTDYFGNEASGDLNGDGLPDAAFILTQSQGGTGTFFYAVAALRKPDGGYEGTNGVPLGDRIAPQSMEIRNGEAVISYTDRKPGEPQMAVPSVGKSLALKIYGTALDAAEWKKYENKEAGISFSYPPTATGSYDPEIGMGDTGKVFGGVPLELSSGGIVYAVATAKDYTAPREGWMFGTQGFVVQNGSYYLSERDQVSGKDRLTKIVPDEFWTIADGTRVPVLIAKDDSPTEDFIPPRISVLINMDGKPFPGIGFALVSAGGASVSKEDIDLFKQIIGSVAVRK